MAEASRQTSRRASTAILALILPVVAIGGVVCWTYYSSLVSSQIAREYRTLQSLGQQIASSIDAQNAVGDEVYWKRLAEKWEFPIKEDLQSDIEQRYGTNDVCALQRKGLTALTSDDAYKFDCCLRTAQGAGVQPEARCKTVLASLLRPALVETLGIDELVVTTGQREILTSWGQARLTIGQLGELPPGDACGMGWWKTKPPADTKEAKEVKAAVQTVTAPLDRSDRRTVCWLGRTYLMFSIPVSLPDGRTITLPVTSDAAAAEAQKLWLHALVSEERFGNDTVRVPYAVIVPGAFVVVFLVLSWPMLRLWTMGARERLRAVDLSILVLCLVAASGTATIGLLAGWSEWHSRSREDADLLRVATQVKDRFRREVHDSIEQMNDLQTMGPVTPRRAAIPMRTPHLMGVGWVSGDGVPLLRLSPVPSAARSWRMQVYSSAQPPVGDRKYFANAQRRDLWRIRSERGARSRPGGSRVSVEVVRSKLTSRLTLVVARPINWRPGIPSDVITASTDLRPFNPPYLPLGYGYAIVADDGAVQLHSEERRSLLENFFEETERDPIVSARVRARSGEPFDMRYLGEDRRAIVVPLMDDGERIPWTIVAFRKRDVLRMVTSESLLAAGVIFASFVVCLALVLLAGHLVSRGGRLEWLWPDRRIGRVAGYTVATVLLVAAARATFDTLDRLGADAGLPVLLAVPLAAIAALSLAMRPRPSPAARRAMEPVVRGAHACLLTALAVLLGILPAAAAFCDARAQAEDDLRTYEMAVQSGQHAERRDAIDRNQARDPAWVIQQRVSDTCDVYGGIERGALLTPSAPRMTAVVRDWLPLGGRNAAMAYASVRDAGPAPSAIGTHEVAVVGGAVALLVLAFVSAAGRALFLLDADGDAGLADRTFAPGAVHWVFERGAEAGSPEPEAPTTLDLRRPPCAMPDWVSRRDLAPPAGRIDILHAERWLADPTARDLLRELLDRLVAANAHVRLESDVDLRKATAEEPVAAGGERAWTALLAGFSSARVFLSIDAALAQAAEAGDDDHTVYGAVWQRLSTDEQQALWQLAREGFVNPGAVDVVRGLLRKGLVRREGALHVATPGLRSFVLRTVAPDDVAKWEGDAAGGWDRRQVSAVLGFAALLLLFIQPDLFNVAVATAGAVTVAVPTLLRFFTMLGEDKAAPRPT